jgi:peptide/nickel transport system permease protein
VRANATDAWWRAVPAAPATLLALVAIAAAAAPLVAPYAPDAIDLAVRRAPPSTAHWFGTDDLGRDLLSRAVFGARLSLLIGVLAAVVSTGIGVPVGAAAGWRRGWTDDVLMRLTDALLAIPRLPLLMIAAALLKPDVIGLILLVGAAGWMETARVVRAEVRSLAGRPFVEAARATGASTSRALMRHVLPNALPAMTVALTLSVARAMLLESALSFFGVGVQPPVASWGSMLYQAQGALTRDPWLAIVPGAAIFGTVLCVNLVGDRLGAGRHLDRT